MAFTKKEFKRLWESNDSGGGITVDDVADCAKAWNLFDRPKTCAMSHVLYAVLVAANVKDLENYKHNQDEDE